MAEPLPAPAAAGEPSGEPKRRREGVASGVPPPPSFREALRYWFLLGFVNFGGPAGQISMMHTDLVERRRWVPEGDFYRAMNFTMILPGPEAQQLATYVGWRLHGTLGGLLAGLFFILPGALVLLALSWLAVAHADVPAVRGVLYGVQPAVVAVVADALLRIGRRTLRHAALGAVAAAAFLAIHFLGVSFPLLILAAALLGLALRPVLPEAFRLRRGPSGAEDLPAPVAAPPLGRALRVVAVCALLWLAPVGALALLVGPSDVLVDEALFFTRAAFITFGGAYAVLTYIADVSVNDFGWLTTPEMVQGLGFAESTPGPLIMVVQYVGFLGAWNGAGGHDPLLWGVLGALVTTYVTFLPCFLFIFAGAPYIEYLAGNRALQAAFTAVTAAVVGVIANLGLFFGEHVLWRGGASDAFALLAAALAYGLLVTRKVGIPVVVLLGAAAGGLWEVAGPGVPL